MRAERRTYPAPSTNVENERYYQAAAEGKLLIGKCKACNEVHHYPRAICPACMSTDVDWVPVSGKGTVYSFSVMRRAPVPYAIAYIRLDEGVTVITNIVDCELDEIAVGQAMQLTFGETEDGHKLPLFTPA
tara:strand:- start:1439 stop:1831 length:393 start_codon:yes stop_codon:yes gene_type:complete